MSLWAFPACKGLVPDIRANIVASMFWETWWHVWSSWHLCVNTVQGWQEPGLIMTITDVSLSAQKSRPCPSTYTLRPCFDMLSSLSLKVRYEREYRVAAYTLTVCWCLYSSLDWLSAHLGRAAGRQRFRAVSNTNNLIKTEGIKMEKWEKNVQRLCQRIGSDLLEVHHMLYDHIQYTYEILVLLVFSTGPEVFHTLQEMVLIPRTLVLNFRLVHRYFSVSE